MSRDEIMLLLETAPTPNNLETVVRQCAQIAASSNKFKVHSKVEGRNLSADHYFRGFSLRAKNPNGVALRMPGFLASLENFGTHNGLLSLIVVELDAARQLSLWISSDEEIIGCMLGIEGGGNLGEDPFNLVRP
jgi:hypothetical protein